MAQGQGAEHGAAAESDEHEGSIQGESHWSDLKSGDADQPGLLSGELSA